MSDSELSDAPEVGIPPDFELENSLRREVNRATKNDEEFTLKSIRTASETRLGLPENFYKDHNVWKGKSKSIVHDQINTEKEVPSSPELKSKSEPPPREDSESPRPAKRKSADAQSPRPKKRKTTTDNSDDLSSALSDIESGTESEVKPKKSTKAGKPPKATVAKKKVKAAAAVGSDEPSGAANGSESEISVVLDEEPKPKKKQRKTKDSEAKTKKPKASKPKASAEDDPDQAEIKRLQQWLVRCGIRKAWGIYLKPYETPKAKIKHLKEMLAEIGMTGRYSQEKAREIKEARELAADIEAVQEGEARWGTKQSEDEDEAQSRGRLVRGARAQYDFLSSDGEETS